MLTALLASMFLIAQGSAPAAQTTNALSLADPVALTSWKRVDRGATMSTNGAELTLTGGQGWWRSEHVWLDYILRVDYRLDSADAEGAVLVRAHHDTVRSPSSSQGYRVALVAASKDQQRKLGTISRMSGTLAETSPVTTPDAASEQARWHSLEVVCIRDRVMVRVDGETVASAVGGFTDGPFSNKGGAGYIGLEHKRGTLTLRNLAVSSIRQPMPDGIISIEDFVGTPPAMRRCSAPLYSEAQAARITGIYMSGIKQIVKIEQIIHTDGTVGAQRIIRSVDPDTDLEALAGARDCLFTPAMLNGQPVPIKIVFETSFSTH